MNKAMPMRPLIMAYAVLALPGLLSQAQAQSMEYRRGYDDGYRAGIEAAREGNVRGGHGRSERGGGFGRIIIEEAVYGERGAVCDARPAVQAMVDRQREPVIYADNRLCGDPAPRRGKVLEITYRCSSGQVLRTVLREETQAVLSCRG